MLHFAILSSLLVWGVVESNLRFFRLSVVPDTGSVAMEVTDLWTFRDLNFSRVVLSRPMIGPFATRYFSHLFDPSRFATSVIFVVCRQLTVNYYSLTMYIMHSRPSSAVRPVRPWPDHFFGQKLFWPDHFFGRI